MLGADQKKVAKAKFAVSRLYPQFHAHLDQFRQKNGLVVTLRDLKKKYNTF
jgi:predicted DsbA family dithiol-disulfide isomerase